MSAKKMIQIGVVLSVSILIVVLVLFIDNGQQTDSLKAKPEVSKAWQQYDILEDLHHVITIDTRSIDKPLSMKSSLINTDISKIEALKGTWLVSHVLGGITPQIDKIVIDSCSTLPNGRIIGKGMVYLSQINQGVLISCGYDPKELGTEYFEYFCVGSRNATSIGYVFRLSENRTIQGFIGVADNLSSIKKQLDNELYKLSGFGLAPEVKSRYQSNFALIQWDKRGEDNEYCLDIADDSGHLLDGSHPLLCGKNMLSFSPRDYLRDIARIKLPKDFVFRWRISSRNMDKQGVVIGIPNYAGAGYEGRVVVDE